MATLPDLHVKVHAELDADTETAIRRLVREEIAQAARDAAIRASGIVAATGHDALS